MEDGRKYATTNLGGTAPTPITHTERVTLVLGLAFGGVFGFLFGFFAGR